MFEERINPILNTNIILYGEQRKMHGLETVFFNAQEQEREGRERKLGEPKFIMFIKASKQLCSAITVRKCF